MINGSNIRLPNGQFSTLVTPVNKDGVTQYVTPVDANGNVISGDGGSNQDVIIFNLSDGAATVGTGKDWISYCPYAYTITNLVLACDTAPTGANLIADLNVNGTSILSTKISIDATETNSTTAATPYVLTTISLALGSKLTVDIDQIGATIAGTNVQLTLYVARV